MDIQTAAATGVDSAPRLLPLTSLRFVAAMMIVGLHASIYFPEAARLGEWPLNHGVSFFFVLSGFILSHAYSDRRLDYWGFIGSRFARLWPLHVVTLLALMVFIREDSRQLPGAGLFDPWLAFASNLTLTHALVPFVNYTFSWNAVSWSISTEMVFYLAFPFLLVAVKRNWRMTLAGAALVIVAYAGLARLFAIPPTSPEPTDLTIAFLLYASPLARGFEFVAGMVTYILWRRWRAAAAGTMAEIGVIVMIGLWSSIGFEGLAPLFTWEPTFRLWYLNTGSTLVCAVAIFVFAAGSGVIGRLLSLKLFVWLGEISFALYMSHQIIMKWFMIKDLEQVLSMPPVWLVVALCIVIAAVLHHLVEKPAQAGLKRLGRSIRSRRFPLRAVPSV